MMSNDLDHFQDADLLASLGLRCTNEAQTFMVALVLRSEVEGREIADFYNYRAWLMEQADDQVAEVPANQTNEAKVQANLKRFEDTTKSTRDVVRSWMKTRDRGELDAVIQSMMAPLQTRNFQSDIFSNKATRRAIPVYADLT